MRRQLLALAIGSTLLLPAGAAQAVVIDAGSAGHFGVALVPNSRPGLSAGALQAAGIPAVGTGSFAPSGSCSDPALASDLVMRSNALCWHGGQVLHSNETFTLTWDPLRRYWEGTRNEVEQFMRNVADGSGTLTSPYALTSQYSDATGRAAYDSRYGGACIDYGSNQGWTCHFPDGTSTGADGTDYGAASNCSAGVLSGEQAPYLAPNEVELPPNAPANDVCITDADVQREVTARASQVMGHTTAGVPPVVVVMTPPGVEVCLNGTGALCSASPESNAGAQFCSYHSQVAGITYVVQPWTALTGCDEPDAPPINLQTGTTELPHDVAVRLISPISQGHIAAIVNPSLDGWSALDGSEINDNGQQYNPQLRSSANFGCTVLGSELDRVQVNGVGYLLQREFNNAWAIESDPDALGCAPKVTLSARFTVPSPVDHGDIVEFDGSSSNSALAIPGTGYQWNFGDGTSAVGASVSHSFVAGGTYTVTLNVTDRGGNQSTLQQQVTVLPVPQQVTVLPLPPPGSTGPGSPGGPTGQSGPLHAHVQLLPRSLRSVLRSGVALRVTSNLRADGYATLSIPKSLARQAHLRTGRSSTVLIGRGTVRGIISGTRVMHIRLPAAAVRRLAHLRHLTLTLRLTLIGPLRTQQTIDTVGRY